MKKYVNKSTPKTKELGDYIPLSRLRKLIENMKDKDPQTPITFEYLMAFCFPTILQSVENKINEAFREGYELGSKKNETHKHN